MSPAHVGSMNHGDIALIRHGKRHDAYAFVLETLLLIEGLLGIDPTQGGSKESMQRERYAPSQHIILRSRVILVIFFQ